MILSDMDTRGMMSLFNDYYSIENTLRRRGLDVKEESQENKVIQITEKFYDLFKSFSFRRILKCIYEADKGVSFDGLLNNISNLNSDSLNKKLQLLLDEDCITYNSENKVYEKYIKKNYSVTFEWLISEVFKRELKGISNYSIKILNLKCGGDFDVISRLEDLLVYVECKSGNISNINEGDINNFLYRFKELVPSLALFIIDTDGLTDEFKAKFDLVDWETYVMKPNKPYRRRKKGRGIFHELNAKIYIITNESNLISNIKLTINHYINFIKPYAFIQPGPNSIAKYYDEYEQQKT